MNIFHKPARTIMTARRHRRRLQREAMKQARKEAIMYVLPFGGAGIKAESGNRVGNA